MAGRRDYEDVKYKGEPLGEWGFLGVQRIFRPPPRGILILAVVVIIFFLALYWALPSIRRLLVG